MALRDEQRELTRRKILGAVLELVADGTLDELSVPAVARRSQVSLATIYRYFPTRDQLLSAAAAEPSRQALNSVDRPARKENDDELASFQRAMWHDFVHNLPLLRHQITSEAGREMRTSRLERSRELLAGYLAQHGIKATSHEGKRLSSLLLLITGSLALVELVDRQGIDVDVAIEQSIWATQTLIDATLRSPTKSAGKQGAKGPRH